jgi:hypothetical protein
MIPLCKLYSYNSANKGKMQGRLFLPHHHLHLYGGGLSRFFHFHKTSIFYYLITGLLRYARNDEFDELGKFLVVPISILTYQQQYRTNFRMDYLGGCFHIAAGLFGWNTNGTICKSVSKKVGGVCVTLPPYTSGTGGRVTVTVVPWLRALSSASP